VPLPSKWIIEFGKPIPVTELPNPFDQNAVLEKAQEIRLLVQNMVDHLIVERGAAF
jgi:hypothetical protein